MYCRCIRWVQSCAWFLLAVLPGCFQLAARTIVSNSPAPASLDAFADVVFEHFTRNSGLPGAFVTALAQDGSGFLWVGTQLGLARWDGYHFRVYQEGKKSAGALPDNIVKSLHVDKQGRLWIGTNAGGLSLYDQERDKFVTYSPGPKGLSHARVSSLADDGEEGLWVGTEKGLDHLDFHSGEIRQVHSGSDLDGQRITALLADRVGCLWVGAGKALYRRQLPRDYRRNREQHSAESGFSLVTFLGKQTRPVTVLSLFEDSGGQIWIGTTMGAYAIEETGKIAVVKLQSGIVAAIAEARSGEVWLATRDYGIAAIASATGRTRRIIHDPTLPVSLADNEVLALFRDRSGLLWVGTQRSLSRCDPLGSGLSTLFSSSRPRRPGRESKASEMDAVFVLAVPDGHTWFGLSSGGVDILDRFGLRTGGFKAESLRVIKAAPLGQVTSMSASEQGDVYLGTSQGLYRSDKAGRILQHLPVPGRDPYGPVYALLVEEKALWVGGNDGLWKIFPEGSVKARPAIHLGTGQGLTDDRISVIHRRGGSLWIGTQKGLNRIELSTLAVERIPLDAEDPEAPGDGMISAIVTDRQERLWVGSFGAGVNVLNDRDPAGPRRFRRIGVAQGLPNATVDDLLQDAAGKIWVSTEDGLAVIDPATFGVRAFHRADGANIQAYWTAAGAVTPGGELIFCGVGGVTVIKPWQLKEWNYRPPVVITDVSAGGKALVPGGFQKPGRPVPLILQPGLRSLAVEFSALDYSAPDRNRYAYRLDGYDKGWVVTSAERRVAEYTNLPVGDFTLHLRGSNRNGVWTDKEVTLPVQVLAAWNETMGFRVAEGLALLMVLGLVTQLRTAYLRRARRILERKVFERTEELENRTRELWQTQEQLEQIAYFDSLTELPNRRRFGDDFRRFVTDGTFSLLLIDFDRFKQINDTLGHDAGDALLKEASKRLLSVVRKTECVARVGGDEFAILLEGERTFQGVEAVCRRITEAFITPILFEGAEMKSSPSIGVAEYPGNGETQEALYKSADLALYEAKRTGGNRWRRSASTSLPGIPASV